MDSEQQPTPSSTDMFTSPVDAALRYAERGWPVFPCREAPDKRPHTEHGFLDASTDAATIQAWWRRWPNAQVGIACGAAGLCVVDLDMGAEKDGIAFFARLEDDYGPHWCGLIAFTPRGGRHLVYLMPDPPVGSGSDIVAKASGVDVRGEGGYIVAPSPASPGRGWVTGDPFERDESGEGDVGQMPKWVEDLVRDKRPAVSSHKAAGESGTEMLLPPEQVDAIRRALAYIDSNPRDTWIRVGMALKSTGAKDQAYELWTEWSQTSPKFDARQQKYQWDSLHEFFLDGREVTLGSLFHLAAQGGYEASLDAEVATECAGLVTQTPAERVDPPNPRRPFPRELLNVPGLVGDVAQWMVESSTRQQHAMCLASSIATLGAVLGRRVATRTDLRTNVYHLGIGETACGKDPSVRLPHLLLTRADLGSLIGPGEWKSDSGLRAALLDAPSHLACCDEFTKLLDAMSGKQVPAYLKGIKRYLLELWAASNSVHLAPAYANRIMNKPTVIEQPNLCVYGTGVPSELFESLDRGALSDGFLNRILVFFADEQMPPRRRVGRAEPPQALVRRLQDLAKVTTVGDLACLPGSAPNARMVDMTADAEVLLGDIEAANDEKILGMRSEGNAMADLWVRFGAHVAKLALIRTVADDPNRSIGLGDVAWARDLACWCLERTLVECESRVSDSPQEALTKRVRRVVEEAGLAGLTSSQLTRRTQWLRRSDRKDIVATLVEGGDIVAETLEVLRSGRGAVQQTVYAAARYRAGSA